MLLEYILWIGSQGLIEVFVASTRSYILWICLKIDSNWHDHTATHDQPDMTLGRGNRPLKLKSLRLGFTFSKPSLRDSRSTWQNSMWTRHVEFCHVDIESLRLGLLKVKPSLRDSSFKACWQSHPGYVWSFHRAVAVWGGLCSCVGKSETNITFCGEVWNKYNLLLAAVWACQRIYSNSTSNKNLSQTLWTYFVCLGT